MLQLNHVNSRNQSLELDVLEEKGVTLTIKREDEIHPVISGNKWRKLKCHLEEAYRKESIGILTYGGAFSNHIVATAYAAKLAGLHSLGVIRGERIEPLNNTLSQAEAQGMNLHFVTRKDYREDKNGLAEKLDPNQHYHHVPEGGADALGVKGCELILTEKDKEEYDVICCSSGTGTTAAGLYNSLGAAQKLRIYPALKGDFAREDIDTLLEVRSESEILKICNQYHFGGYAKTSKELFDFMRDFRSKTGIKTDPIYTAKMLYGLIEDIRKDLFEVGTRILAIHTGGLQGIAGIEERVGVRIYDVRSNN